MTATTTPKKSWKDSFEFRALKFLLRVIGVLFFLGYLMMSVPGAWTWIQAKWVQTLPLSALPEVANDYAMYREADKLTKWISLRPRSERAEIMKMLEPVAGKLPPVIFTVFAQWKLDEADGREAVFWWQYAMFRLRYDALRCGSPVAIDNLITLVNDHTNPRIQQQIDLAPENIPGDIQRVLDMDARLPAENDPYPTCITLQQQDQTRYAIAPVEEWNVIRHGLRMTTEVALKSMLQNAPQEKTE